MPVMKIKAILLPFGEVDGCIRSATLDQGSAVPFEGPGRRRYLALLVSCKTFEFHLYKKKRKKIPKFY